MTAMAFGHARRLLIIDDDPSVLEAIRETVLDLGYAADGATSGAEGLALFERGRYDAVLTDLRMPGLTGWDVLEAVRRRRPAMPVILITGLFVPEDDPRLRERGVALLRKPVDALTLHAALLRLLVEGL
jgi:CheY-like chemotaxis protein